MTRYRFESCSLDVDRRQLLLAGQTVDVQPLIFDLLAYFARHPQRVIGREELLKSVWRSPVVTASVVARAVMKARRAIGDDAAAPRILLTATRAGYRLACDVHSAPTAPAYRLAMLPFRERGQGATSAFNGQGLTQLADHLIKAQASLNLAPADDVKALATSALSSNEDALEQICDLLGAEEALACELEPQGGRLTLHVRHGANEAQALHTRYEGEDAYDLTQRMVADLVARVSQRRQEWSIDKLWRAQFVRALELGAQGEFGQSLQTLVPCLPHLEVNASVRSLHAQLLHHCNRLDEALEQIERAMRGADAAPGTAIRCGLLLTRTWLLFEHEQPAAALATAIEAELAAGEHPDGRTQLPEILSCKGMILQRLSRFDAALVEAQRAVSKAVTLGNVALEARCRIRLATMYVQMDRLQQAPDAVQQATSAARRCGLPRLEIEAVRLLSFAELQRRNFSQAAAFAQHAQARFASAGDDVSALRMKLVACLALLELNALDQVQALLDAEHALAKAPAAIQAGIGVVEATLAWKRGEGERSNAILRKMLSASSSADLSWTHWVAFTLQRQYIELGQMQSATDLLPLVQKNPVLGNVASAEAALALARGERQVAMARLQAHRSAHATRNEADMDVCIEWAWLLLEDENPAAPDGQLDALASDLLDYAPELLSAKVFRAAYLMRRAPSASAMAHWDALVAEAAPLARNCAWMLQSDYRDALVCGSPARLRQLLTQACC